MAEDIGNIDADYIIWGKIIAEDGPEVITRKGTGRTYQPRMNLLTEYPDLPQISNEYE